ncbi:MAG: hypothetical protein KGJ93_04230 [Patescibacteria group bacterium]|nr:hypothetical protein [Patescibacteria group bacterium]
MNRKYFQEFVGWGIALWLIGYALGFVLFFVVPQAALGWVIMPIGTAVTLWVLFKKIAAASLSYYLALGLSWALLAMGLDYVFLVKLLKPGDGYYKADVYLYYILTLVLPVVAGLVKRRQNLTSSNKN